MANIHKKRNIRTVSMAAMVLAAALFSAGCGSGTAETAESGTAETGVSNVASTLEGEDTEEGSLASSPDTAYFPEDIDLERVPHEQDIYYAFYDVDGNGTEEIIIAGGETGITDSSVSPWKYDLYGYDGTKAVRIFPDMEFGYRTNFDIYADGVIEIFYSSSAAESGVDFYRIGDDGVTPELIDSFSTVGHLEGEEPVFDYYQNGNKITKEEYSSRIQEYENDIAAGFDWIKKKRES